MSPRVVRTLDVETPEAVSVSYPLAGIGSRAVAAVLDMVFLGGLILAELAVAWIAGELLGRAGLDLGRLGAWLLAVLAVVVFVTYWGYFIFGEVFRNGRTPGKRRQRIRVVRLDGSRIGVLESVIRNVVRLVDILPGTYAVGVTAMLFSRQGQRLGDMAAGTVVIAEPLRSATLDRLGPAEERAELVREYLARRAAFSDDGRWQVGVELLALYGEQPAAGWDEPVVAGRLVDLAGLREELS